MKLFLCVCLLQSTLKALQEMDEIENRKSKRYLNEKCTAFGFFSGNAAMQGPSLVGSGDRELTPHIWSCSHVLI